MFGGIYSTSSISNLVYTKCPENKTLIIVLSAFNIILTNSPESNKISEH